MPRYLLVQFSDVHLSADGTLSAGGRPRDNFVAGLALLAAASIRPDVIVLTGDLADTGDPACYEDLAKLLDTEAPALGASVVCLPGNHDAREAFRRHLLGEPGAASPINQVHWCRGLRLVALDSTVPGEDYGVLADETLDFLRDALATPAPDGTVLALHHPPITTPIEPMARVRLREPERLADAIAGSDVRLVLCGHNHHQALGTLGSAPVWVSPASAYRADVTSREVFRPLPGSAFSRIDLDEAGPLVTVVPVS